MLKFSEFILLSCRLNALGAVRSSISMNWYSTRISAPSSTVWMPAPYNTLKPLSSTETVCLVAGTAGGPASACCPAD